MIYSFFAADPERAGMVASGPGIDALLHGDDAVAESDVVTGPDPEQLMVLHRLVVPDRDPDEAVSRLIGSDVSDRVLLLVSGWLSHAVAELPADDLVPLAQRWHEAAVAHLGELGVPGGPERLASVLRELAPVCPRADEIDGYVFVDGNAR